MPDGQTWNSGNVIKTGILIGLAALLVYQLAGRSEAERTTRGSENLTTSTEIRAGERLADVELVSLGDGPDPSRVSLRGLTIEGCHYLMIYAAECPWCAMIAPTWSGATKVHFDGADYPITWISVGPDNGAAQDYMNMHDLRFPAFAVASAEDSRRLGWVKVPSLWLIRGDTVVSTVEPTRHNELGPPRAGDCDSEESQ